MQGEVELGSEFARTQQLPKSSLKKDLVCASGNAVWQE
jgi:hypothetical protein